MRCIVESHAATIDLGDIIDYLVKNADPDAARSVLLAIRDAYDLLGAMPGLGVICRLPNLQVQDMRMWTVSRYPNYLIF